MRYHSMLNKSNLVPCIIQMSFLFIVGPVAGLVGLSTFAGYLGETSFEDMLQLNRFRRLSINPERTFDDLLSV